ncbi:MAG: acyltransferase, partial [Treponema sp.]|nr:acyltransferase [Treponema sp.]
FAFIIFLHHYSIFNEGGVVSVEYFFILSGFVISFGYQRKILNGYNIKDFLINRIIKLYPLHILTFFFSFVFTIRAAIISNGNIYFKSVILNITLLQSFVPKNDYYFSFNALSWFLSDILFFYLMFPLLINLLMLLGKVRIYNKLMLSFLILYSYIFASSIVPEEYTHAIFYINPILRIFDFFIGIILFYIYEKIKQSNILKTNKLLTKKCIPTLIELLSVFILIIAIVFSKNVKQVYRFACYYWVPISILILGFSQVFGEGIFSKILSQKIFTFLGKISFSFYMLHQIMLGLIPPILGKLFNININGINSMVRFCVLLSIILLSSIFCFYVYEIPIGKCIKNKISKK